MERATPTSPRSVAKPQISIPFVALRNPRSVAEPNSSRLATEPQSPRFVTEPKSPRLVGEPNSPRFVAEPGSPSSVAKPKSSRLVGEPCSPRIVAELASPRSVAVPTTPRIDEERNTPRSVAEHKSPRSVAEPKSPRSVAEPRSPRSVAESIGSSLGRGGPPFRSGLTSTVHSGPNHVPGLITSLSQDGDLDRWLDEVKDRWVVVEFVADWSATCLAMRQPFEDLAKEYTNAVFLNVNVDTLVRDASRNAATKVPTYAFFWNTQKETQFAGCSERKLRELMWNCDTFGPCPVEVTYRQRQLLRMERENTKRLEAEREASIEQSEKSVTKKTSTGDDIMSSDLGSTSRIPVKQPNVLRKSPSAARTLSERGSPLVRTASNSSSLTSSVRSGAVNLTNVPKRSAGKASALASGTSAHTASSSSRWAWGPTA
eukprot:TRINITY_DN61973_c0_g1_i1.p1 TRINITY_DN61973_c0_g1~~TRINITY_DN61973_c0_g1_i1.p1  ORF type:complete len:429 (-),score=36.61 TRINITY_DN61973_c0_g1_i1:98-1384(-)